MWRAVRGRAGSATATSFSASRPTLVIRFTSAISRSLPSGHFTIRVATDRLSEGPLELQRPARLAGGDLGLDAGHEVAVGVPHAVGVERPEDPGRRILHGVDLPEQRPGRVAVRGVRAVGLARGAGPRAVVGDLGVDDDRGDVDEPEDELARGDGGPLRPLAVLELPCAEREPVEQVHPLLDAHDLARRTGPELLLREQPSLRLVGEPLLLGELLATLAQRREGGLVLLLHRVEELDDGRRDEEGVERVVGLDRKEVHERGESGEPVAELVLGDPEHPVGVHGLLLRERRRAGEELAERPCGVGVGAELEAIPRALQLRRCGEGEGEQEWNDGDHGSASAAPGCGPATVTDSPARILSCRSLGGAPAGASGTRSSRAAAASSAVISRTNGMQHGCSMRSWCRPGPTEMRTTCSSREISIPSRKARCAYGRTWIETTLAGAAATTVPAPHTASRRARRRRVSRASLRSTVSFSGSRASTRLKNPSARAAAP